MKRQQALTAVQRAERSVARRVLRLSPATARRVAGKPIERDGQRLDTQVQLLLRMAELRGGSSLQTGDLLLQRHELEVEAGFFAPQAGPLASTDTITVAGGDVPIGARVYTPRDAMEPAPAVVFYHGGGFVLGSLDSHDDPCRTLAYEGGCKVISVDYRLAPEHPAPAAVEDAVAAFRDLVKRSGELGVDPKRIAVSGDSAGGNLAAVVAQQTASDTVSPCFQLLFYPVVDAIRNFPSMELMAEGFMLEKASIEWYREQYLRGGIHPADPRVSPIYGKLSGLAPAFVMTAGFDPLRDEGEAYAREMEKAGVTTRCKRYPSLIHGFINMAGSIHAARAALDDAVMALRDALT